MSGSVKFCLCDDADGARILGRISSQITQANALGDMLTYVPNVRNLHYWPIDTVKVSRADAPRVAGPLRIAHAPNHTHFKGSHYLEACIERLRAQGHEIDYVKIQGVPNAEVMRIFGEADVVADQFIGGAYGYTALEAMARGKPVLTYVRSTDLVEAVDECPLINVTPDNLFEVLLWILANRSRLPAIGEQGRVYVEKWHSIAAVAERLGRLYEETGDFPKGALARIHAQRKAQEAFREGVTGAVNWAHPWRIGISEHQRQAG